MKDEHFSGLEMAKLHSALMELKKYQEADKDGRLLENLLGRRRTFCGVAGTQAGRFLQLRRAKGGVTNGIFC